MHNQKQINKQERLENFVSWWKGKKNTFKILPVPIKVLEHMLTHRFITEITYKKMYAKKGSSTHLANIVQQLRTLGADITSMKYKQGGKVHYSLRDKAKLSSMLVEKQPVESAQPVQNAQPVMYSKATKFELVENNMRQDNVEIPVYYWEDDRELVHVDRELMCKEFNERLDELEQEFQDAWNDKQKDYANDSR
tara:strand:+ start:2017 stop:2598 length:582 start_codon:yes stop_codon:yes gene_type:complete